MNIKKNSNNKEKDNHLLNNYKKKERKRMVLKTKETASSECEESNGTANTSLQNRSCRAATAIL